MPNETRTVIVTGASQGIGAAIVKTFLERGYAVVATSRDMTKSGAFAPSDKLALVDGDIGASATAATIAQVAMSKFGSIDALINNAGIFIAKPFIEYTPEDFKTLASINLEGFIYISQLAIKQMLAQKTGGSIVSITGSLADHPIAGVKCFGCDDHEGWNLDRHAKSRDGICKEQHSRERGRAGSRRHPAAQKRFSECFNLYLYGRFRRIGVHGAT